LVNTYTTGFSSTALNTLLKLSVGEKFDGVCSSTEIGLDASSREISLPCGISGRWEQKSS